MATNSAFKRALVTTTRSGLQRNRLVQLQRRSLFEGPNTIKKQQADFQRGATPYLRGDADPTYLRKGGDRAVFLGCIGATAFCWAYMAIGHFAMWNR